MEQAMIYGRHVDFESLRRANLDIQSEIEAAGWMNFLKMREVVFQNEVFDFWKNVKIVNNTIVSSVDGFSIIVTKELIEKVTECSSSGEQLLSKPRWMAKLNVNEEQVNRLLYGENDPTERKTSSLVPKARVLHAILFNCVLPRAGSRHLVTTLDEQCIFYLLNFEAIDLPFLIFQYMVKAMKDTNSYPYGMLLTRIFKETGIPLGGKNSVPVKSSINFTTVAKMGLRNTDRLEAELRRKVTTEGERPQKKTSDKPSKPQAKETRLVTVVRTTSSAESDRRRSSEETVRDRKTSQEDHSRVRVIEKGTLKRQGEILLSDIPKQPRRSPRVNTVRQSEERQSREAKQVENTELRAPKTTRSLISILREDAEKQVNKLERKRKLEEERQRPQRSPKKIDSQPKEKVSKKKSTPTAEKEISQDVIVSSQEVNILSDNPIFEEVGHAVTTPTLVQTKEPEESSNEQSNSSSLLTKEDLEYRVVEMVEPEPKRNSIIIREKPRRIVKVHYRSLLVNERTTHLMDEGDKSYYEQLLIIGKTPYPPQIMNKSITMFPVLEQTVIKFVPDIQPPYHPMRNTDKGKEKVYAEPVLNDLTQDEIEEEVHQIDEACDLKRKAKSMCVYQDPGPSGSRSTEDDPVGGTLVDGQYNPVKVADMECVIESIVQAILSQRPLWLFTSMADIIPFIGKPTPRLPAPDDLDLPEPLLPVQPPLLQILEDIVPSADAYNTTVAFAVEQPQEDVPSITLQIVPFEEDQPSEAEQSRPAPDLEARIINIEKEVRKCHKLLKKVVKFFGI